MMFFIQILLSVPLWAISLDQAVESALKKNESVDQSLYQLRQAEEIVRQTKGAILPSLTLNGTHLIQPKVSDPVAAQFFPETQTTANLTLTQPIFRGLREFAALRRQKNLLSAQEQTHLTQMTDLYQKVAESYMQVLSLEQDLRNLEAQSKIYQVRIRDLQGRARRGESSTTETLTAQSTAAALDAELQIQNAKLRSARENFALLTGLPKETPLDEIDELDSMTPPKPLETYLARVDERPDVKNLKERSEAANEDVSIAKGAHWPTADFTGNYYLVRPDGYTKDMKWDVQFKVTLPLYEGGLRQSQVREANLKLGENNMALNQLRRQSEAEIRSLHEAVRIRSEQLKALKLASDLSEKNYQVLLRDSRRGLIRSIDVQLGLTEYRATRRAYDQARYEARLERVRLDIAAAFIPTILTNLNKGM